MSTDTPPTPRRRTHRGEPPPSFLPVGNPPARLGYLAAWLGLIPGLGLLFGGPAIIFGLLGKRHAANDPERRGAGHAFVSWFAGSVELTSNAAGWYVLAMAYGWL